MTIELRPDRAAVLTVPCPQCNAAADTPCLTDRETARASTHTMRVALWQALQRELAKRPAPAYHRAAPDPPPAIDAAEMNRGRVVIAAIRDAMTKRRG